MRVYSVVFFGTPDFAVPSLEALIKDPTFDVKLVVTQPDKHIGRKKVLTAPPVKVVGERHRIPVLQPEDVNHEVRMKNQECDYFVVVAYGKVLSSELLKIPAIAAVNLHASLLPRWRGASPIQHAILMGDTETGVTVQQMVPALDAGAILGQRRISLDNYATYTDIHDRLKGIGAELLLNVLSSPLKPVPQDEALVTTCHKFSRADSIVDLQTHSALEIDRRVRALNPWPGVTCVVEGEKLKIIETSLKKTTDGYPLPCRDGSMIYLMRVQEPGKRVMSAIAWARGRDAAAR